MSVPLADQISELVKTIYERERYFTRLVDLGKVEQHEVDERLKRTRAARLTLELIHKHEDEVRNLLRALK